MNQEYLKKIPLSSFNDEGWLKVPLSIYFNLTILAKGLLLFIMSLASIGKSDQLLTIFFPEKSSLYIALALSVIPLSTIVLFSIGKIQDTIKLKKAAIIICMIQVIIELTLLSFFIYNAYQPFESSYFFILLGYLLILFLTTTSYRNILFVRQILTEKGVIEKKEPQAPQERTNK